MCVAGVFNLLLCFSGLEEGECALSVDQMDSSSSAHQLLVSVLVNS